MNSDSCHSSPRVRPERVRVQKIRNCCDACSISKTKCDQTRPSCARCQKNRLDCNYSVSQRKGKPPAASRHLSTSLNARKVVHDKRTPEPIRASIESSAYDIKPEVVGTPTFHFDSDTSMTDIFLSSYDDSMPHFSQPLVPDINDFHASAYSLTQPSLFDHDLSGMSTPNMERSSSYGSNDNYFSLFPSVGPQPTSSPADFTLPQNSLPTPPMIQGEHSPGPRFDCAKLASSTLEGLNLNAEACTYACTVEANSASLDQILIATKGAVANTHELLSCPCSSSQHSNLMVSCIIDKILGLYQAAIRAESYTPAARSSSPLSDSSSRGRVSPTPITIGAYQMDAKDEQRMRMQLVSNELRKAATLVERYSDKYRNMAHQEREDTGVSTALVNLLRKRLREAGSDVNNALRLL